jgi:acyl-[acyl carrier protein]--UDP-N-acetylglucosamine O-acyltransferase
MTRVKRKLMKQRSANEVKKALLKLMEENKQLQEAQEKLIEEKENIMEV